jgi:hypothetical protein
MSIAPSLTFSQECWVLRFKRMSTDYKELAAWQRSMDLVREVYRFTRSFPREELFGLSSQMRRSAVSVPSNIAEGKGRYSRKELIQFLYKSSRLADGT